MTIEGGGLVATIEPWNGGRISSLRDDAREWLLQPARPRGPGDPRAGAFVSPAMGGWDECAPSIERCVVDGREIPDHGDVWRARLERDGSVLRFRGPGYTFERRIEAEGNALRLSYRVRTSRTMPFLWAAHPQFSAPPGTRVELPDAAERIVDVTAGRPEVLRWSRALGSIDHLAARSYRKYYVDPDRRLTTARLVHADGDAIRLEWSRNVNYLGIWFDNSAIAHAPVIAVEPATGYFDSLARAIALRRASRLRAGLDRKWWVKIARDR